MKKGCKKTTESEIDKVISERNFYRRILDRIPAVVHVNNLKTKKLEWINGATINISGYTPEEILTNRKYFSSIIKEEDLEWYESSLEDYKSLEGVYSAIYSMKHADGTMGTYHSIGVVLDYDKKGKPIRNVVIDINITHEVRNYTQLRRHCECLAKKLHNTLISTLTSNELRIVKFLCLGKTIKQISIELERSYHTIDNHKRNIFKKIGIHSTRELVTFAKEVGLG